MPLALSKPLAAYSDRVVAPLVSSNLSRAMGAAGIARAGVRPRSVREYAANAAYAQSGRIEDVAAFMGLSSLDTTRHLIDPQWQDQWGDHVRGGGFP